LNSAITYYRALPPAKGCAAADVHVQRTAIEDFASESGLALISAHEEIGADDPPGELAIRPGLARALSEARKRKCPLIVAGMEQLADDVTTMADLMAYKVSFIIVDGSGAAFVVRPFSSQAFRKPKTENADGRSRALEAMALARAAQVAVADQHAVDTMPIVRRLQSEGVRTLSSIAAELNRREVPTTRGGRWHPSTVRDLLNRSAALSEGGRDCQTKYTVG
jgi:hypothetical protein